MGGGDAGLEDTRNIYPSLRHLVSNNKDIPIPLRLHRWNPALRSGPREPYGANICTHCQPTQAPARTHRNTQRWAQKIGTDVQRRRSLHMERFLPGHTCSAMGMRRTTSGLRPWKASGATPANAIVLSDGLATPPTNPPFALRVHAVDHGRRATSSDSIT